MVFAFSRRFSLAMAREYFALGVMRILPMQLPIDPCVATAFPSSPGHKFHLPVEYLGSDDYIVLIIT
eukprot:m.1514 g.1514  ORF g.1514 m.1514 type:complete len:67 (-) comp1020_c1_seq1:69-269(-)